MAKSTLPYLIIEAEKETLEKKTVILFHGGESSPETFRTVTPYFPEFRIILPQGPLKVSDNTFNWFNFRDNSLEIDNDSLKKTIQPVKQFIEEIKAEYLNEHMFIGGISQGAIFAYEVFLDQPKHVSGFICLSGFLPEWENYPLLTKKDIFVAHGENDPLIPVQTACNSIDLLHNLGAKVEFNTYEMGHEMCDEELRDVCRWLKKL